MAMLFITHDLGHRAQIRRPCLRDEHGKIVETGPTARCFPIRSMPTPSMLLAAEPKGEPPCAEAAPEVMQAADDLKVWFPVKQGFLRRTVDHIKAVDGRRSPPPGQTLGVVGESGSGKTTLGLA
jgi:microcin C transport system ATP-binding protein